MCKAIGELVSLEPSGSEFGLGCIDARYRRTTCVRVGSLGEKLLQAVKVELIINLKTAKTLGITIPLPLLGCVDEVIE